MVDLFNVVELNPADNLKIKQHLEKIRQAQNDSGELTSAINSATEEFNKFFLNYGKASFSANELRRNTTPTSKEYNTNLDTLSEDLGRLFRVLEASTKTTLSAFNYSNIISKEVSNEAALAASRVLDLNILSSFVKGTTIVGGDDFLDDSKIDLTVGVDTTQAQLLRGASAISLLTVDAEVVSNQATKIEVTPLEPIGGDGKVNRDPTPENVERFYEGNYYGIIGDQRPEGGNLQFKYIVDPADIPPAVSIVTAEGNLSASNAANLVGSVGFYAVVPPTQESLNQVRFLMTDGNPSTFWEGEYVFAVPSLITFLTKAEESE